MLEIEQVEDDDDDDEDMAAVRVSWAIVCACACAAKGNDAVAMSAMSGFMINVSRSKIRGLTRASAFGV